MKQVQKLKIGYLYIAKDPVSECIFLVEEITDTYNCKIIDDFKSPETIGDNWNLSAWQISTVPETAKDFENSTEWACYEIGPKEDHPEYFL